MSEFRNVATDQKKTVGMKINELKQLAQAKINDLREQLETNEAQGNDIDLTRTAYPVGLGSRHPLTLVKKEIIDIFARMGFTLYQGPEIDEHVWTSPKKAMEIVKKIAKVASEIDTEEKTKINDNAEKYVAEIAQVDKDLHQAIDGKISEIVVADRFPFRYFADEFGLKYAAAFSGCSEQTEASAKTISFLINKVKQDKVKKIYKIELSNGKIAETVSKDTGAEVLELHSAHNVTADDFSKGVTYVDLMKRNLVALSK